MPRSSWQCLQLCLPCSHSCLPCNHRSQLNCEQTIKGRNCYNLSPKSAPLQPAMGGLHDVEHKDVLDWRGPHQDHGQATTAGLCAHVIPFLEPPVPCGCSLGPLTKPRLALHPPAATVMQGALLALTPLSILFSAFVFFNALTTTNVSRGPCCVLLACAAQRRLAQPALPHSTASTAHMHAAAAAAAATSTAAQQAHGSEQGQHARGCDCAARLRPRAWSWALLPAVRCRR